MNFVVTENSAEVVFSDGTSASLHKESAGAAFQRVKSLLQSGASESEVRRFALLPEDIHGWCDLLSFRSGTLYLDELAVPDGLAIKIIDVCKEGISPVSIRNFYKNCQRLSSEQAVRDVLEFAGACQMPITQRGTIIAFRTDMDSFDHKTYSGSFDVTAGNVVSIPKRLATGKLAGNRSSHHLRLSSSSGSKFGSYSGVFCEMNPADFVRDLSPWRHGDVQVSRYKVLGTCTVSDPAKEAVTPWDYLNLLPRKEDVLLVQNRSDLRAWATRSLGIKNAGQVRGGKLGLVRRILEVLREREDEPGGQAKA